MFVPESCVDHREVGGEALTGAPIGQPLSRERSLIPGADAFYSAEGSMRQRAIASAVAARRGRRPWHVGTRIIREPGGLRSGHAEVLRVVRVGKASSHKPTMYGPEKSDPCVVAMKSVNKSARPDAESMEPRQGAKGTTSEKRTCRTQRRTSVSQRLTRVRAGAQTLACLRVKLPRWEPGALVAHAGICAGGAP